MATYKELLPSDIKTSTSYLVQLVDVLQEDISTAVSRRHYQHFVTGSSISPGVTSSLYQTVYDSDFSLQTSNPVFDVTVGIKPGGYIAGQYQTGTDSTGKELFPNTTLMMREKIDNYRSFAQALLGDASMPFTAPLDSVDPLDAMDSILVIAFKRLFARDSLKRETFAMRYYPKATSLTAVDTTEQLILTDIGSATNRMTTFGGQVGNIVDASNVSNVMGLMFYDRGVMVLDLEKLTTNPYTTNLSGAIDTVTTAPGTRAFNLPFIPQFLAEASIDNIVDHIANTRFGTTGASAMTFQNQTNINSTLIFCRLFADEFNYSSNPTFTDDQGRIVTIEQGQEDVQTSFTMLTGVGLYDANDTLLAVAKLSRPVEKSNERDLTLRIRLDF